MDNFNLAVVCLTMCIIIGGRGVDSQSYTNASDLRSSLLSSYNTDVIPLNNQSDIFNVTITLNLHSQPDVDPVRGSIYTAMVLDAEWTDELITWTPSQHSGIENVLIKSSEVWTPTICIAQSMTFQPLSGSWIRIKYSSNGSALFTPGDVYETSCTFNMKYWPFDKHACYITFYSFDYATDRLQIVASNVKVSSQFYVQNGEWYLNTDSIEYRIGTTGVPSITYKLLFDRQPAFYLLTIILPINGIGALNCFVFLLPRGSRIGYSVTIMLSLAVYLTVVTDELPKRSDPIPIMCVYILFATIMSVLVAVMVILNLKLYDREKDVPEASLFKMIVKFSRCRRNKVEGNQDEGKDSHSVNEQLSKSNSVAHPNKQEASETKQALTDIEADNSDSDSITWQDLSEAIDTISFYTLFIVTYIPSIIIIMSVAFASDYYTDSVYWSL